MTLYSFLYHLPWKSISRMRWKWNPHLTQNLPMTRRCWNSVGIELFWFSKEWGGKGSWTVGYVTCKSAFDDYVHICILGYMCFSLLQRTCGLCVITYTTPPPPPTYFSICHLLLQIPLFFHNLTTNRYTDLKKLNYVFATWNTKY